MLPGDEGGEAEQRMLPAVAVRIAYAACACDAMPASLTYRIGYLHTRLLRACYSMYGTDTAY
eukprot:3031524-Rhodomonas_salina.1